MVDEKESKEKKKTGRPVGKKSELGIPIKGIKEAVELTKMAHEQGKDNIMSFSEMAGYMNLKKGSDTPTIGALKWYGLVEQSDGGWRISDSGQKAIIGDKESIRTAFEKVNLFRELSSQFAEKNVSIGLIIDYIKKKYRRGDNEKRIIAQRFVEGLDYIKNLTDKSQIIEVNKFFKTSEEVITLIKLKYALTPPSDKDIKELAEDVWDKLKDNQNNGIKILAENIHKNKDNKEGLKPLVDSLIGILNIA